MAAQLTFFVPLLLLASAEATCNCTNTSWCAPVNGPLASKEVFAFSTFPHVYYPSYDWTLVSTVAVFGEVDPALVCFAHARGARVVVGASIANSLIGNTTAEEEWIAALTTQVVEQHLDGVNLDIEGNNAHASALTALTKQVTAAIKAAVPTGQVSFDTSIYGDNSPGYDWLGIANAVDFVVPVSRKSPT